MRDNSERARYAILLLWISLGMEVLMFLSNFLSYRLCQALITAPDTVSDLQLEMNDNGTIGVAVLYTLVYFVSAYTFIRWFRRAYYNLHTRVSGLVFDEKFAAFAWFIPVVNWFRPYQIMRELYEKTASYLQEHLEGYDIKPAAPLLGFWWFLWMADNISNIMSDKIYPGESLEDIAGTSMVVMCISVVAIPLCFVAIQVVKRYASMEEVLIGIEDGGLVTDQGIDLGDDILDGTF